jgi:hypothetical protein
LGTADIAISAEATAPVDGERKTVTALFADIKGSIELIEDLDPEEAQAIVNPALKLMIDAVRRYDGYIVQSTGDGIFALFGAPVAHEDHPQRALYAALRMQDEMRRFAERLRAEKGGQSPSPRRRQRWRCGSTLDSDRGETGRIYPDRAFHQPYVAFADAGESGLNRDQRWLAQTGRGFLHAEGAGTSSGQGFERSSQCL